MKRKGAWTAALAALCLLAPAAVAAEKDAPSPRPRLVVVISVDQLRPGYLDRFNDLFLPAESEGRPGGFRYLMEKGARHLDAHQDHLATQTGPGHAAILTGAFPYKHGIVANSWYDRRAGRELNCVEDPESPQVGVEHEIRGASPANLLVTTLGDELKMAAGSRAKVWSISYKDRSAILMGGHLADGVLWFDSREGRWVTSTWYAPEGRLPEFITAWNARQKPHEVFGSWWNLSVPQEALARLWEPGGGPVRDTAGLGKAFPHRLDGGLPSEDGHFPHGHTDSGESYFGAFIASPHGNGHILETARQIVGTQRMGKDDIPDMLAIGLSTMDYTGHIFGPHSPEILDVTVRLDGQLSGFFRWLDGQVDGGLERVVLVLTADHGVAPIIPGAMEAGLPGGLLDMDALQESVESALDREVGEERWVLTVDAGYVYLDREAMARRGVEPSRAEEVAARAIRKIPGIHDAWTRTALSEGRVPRTELAERASRNFHPGRSGDVLIVEEPQWGTTWARAGATHGSPYGYDTAVPLLMAGSGIRPGVYARRVATADIAPTLAALLSIPAPSGSEGRVLGHLLRGAE